MTDAPRQAGIESADGSRPSGPRAAGPPPGASVPEILEETAGAEDFFAEQAGVPATGDADYAEPSPLAPVEGEEGPAELAAVAKERDEFRDSLIRLQADFENYKKRMAKQQVELRERAAEDLVEKLLPVLDTSDLALAHGGGDDVKQVTAALASALEREGLERIDAMGAPFDPTLHDAVAHEPGDGHTQEVAEVMRAGYRWRGRVLRPALVKVRG